MTQKRQTQSKELLKEALTQLLATERFEDITISMLTRKAGLNRGTFYLHYTDKYDMIDKLKAEMIQQMEVLLTLEEEKVDTVLLQALTYIYEQQDFIYAISRVRFVNFRKTIRDFIQRLLEKEPYHRIDLADYYQLPENYALIVYLSSIEGVILHWIQSHFQESPEAMTQIILQII